MKKIVFIAIAAIALTFAAQAQDTAAHQKMMTRQGRMQRPQMFEELNLTQDQKDKMKKLRADDMAKMEQVRNDNSLNDDQKQEKIKTLRAEQRRDMEAILTDEQKAKMKQLREERMKEHKMMKPGADSASHH